MIFTSSATLERQTEQRSRLSGLTGTLSSENVEIDLDGNTVRTTTHTDPTARLVTQSTDVPGSDLPAVAVTYNGLLVAEAVPTIAEPLRYTHDALGRVVSLQDPRHTQPTTLDYDPTTGQLAARTDPAGHTTTFTYHPPAQPGAGRVAVETDDLGQTRRTAYDLLGRVVQQWGSADYPQAYAYTAHGELHTLTTWRDAGSTDFDATTWPAPTGGDVTTWEYQAATGLLTRKQYHDGQGTDYTVSVRPGALGWSLSKAGS